MKHIKLYIIPVFLFILCATSCKETLEINDNDLIGSVQAPEINDFAPASGSAGMQVTINGKGFSIADSVFVGGVKTKIKSRVSDTSIIVELTGMEASGKIKVFNPKGNGESGESFTMVYKQPEDIQLSINPGDLLVSGTSLDISGANLAGVDSIFLSGASNRVAKILYQDENKITIELPVTCDTEAAIKMKYYEQATAKYWTSDVYSTNKIIIPPVFSNVPARAYVGQSIFIDAENANMIDSIYFREKNLTFELVSDNSIKIIMPDDYTAGISGDLSVMHNACEEEVIQSDFNIVVPQCYAYFDVYMTAQGGNGGGTGATSNNSFFDAEMGGTYSTCDVKDHPQDVEFISYSNGSGAFVFYGPHALSQGTIKNFYCVNTAGTLGNWEQLSLFNAVTVKFRVLGRSTDADAKAAELALAEKFNNNEIVDITSDLFTGITAPASNNMSYFKYASGNSTYLPGEIIWFHNSFTNKSGLMRVNSVSYSGIVQDRVSSALIDVLYQK